LTLSVAFLRGVNVGGHRRVKMDSLKEVFETLGYGRVQTYIQSGNVLFEWDPGKETAQTLRRTIEDAIVATFGFPVSVALRTEEEIARIIDLSPFDAGGLSEGESVYVAMLLDAPERDRADRLNAHRDGVDDFRLLGREVYVLYRQSAHESRLSNSFFERMLGVLATTRNWQTLTKLCALAQTGGR
jgi:uncharacterized protein (DUF1697 family)